MKTKFWLLFPFILLTFCNRADKGEEYTLKIRNTSFQRDGRAILNQGKLESCLEKYRWRSNETHFSSEEALVFFNIEPLIEGNKHLVQVSLESYKKFVYADQWLKSRMEHANKPQCFEPYLKIKDAAFISTAPECVPSGWAEILYSNWLIEVEVFPFGKPQSARSATDDYKRLKKQILIDFLDDFYPYFRNCAEQAKVPVNSESTK